MTGLYPGRDCLLTEVGARISNEIFVRNMYVPYYNVDWIRTKYDNTSIHASTWSYDNKDNIDESNIYGDFYMDFDSRDNFELVREDAKKAIGLLKVLFFLKPEEIRVFFSGRKGVHIIVPAITLGIVPCLDLHLTFKHIARYLNKFLINKTIDTQVYHKRAMLRISNSIHESSSLYKIQLSHAELCKLSHEEIKEKAKQNRKLENTKPTFNTRANKRLVEMANEAKEVIRRLEFKQHQIKLDFEPDCIKSILTNDTVQGSRNHVLALLASYFKVRGFPTDKAVAVIKEWNTTYCTPKVSEQEILNTVGSLYSGNKVYGCSSLSEYGECSKEKCKIYRKREDT